MVAATDELFRLTIILRQKMAKTTLHTFARCVIFNVTANYMYVSDV